MEKFLNPYWHILISGTPQVPGNKPAPSQGRGTAWRDGPLGLELLILTVDIAYTTSNSTSTITIQLPLPLTNIVSLYIIFTHTHMI